MSDKAFKNVIDGNLVDAVSGETYDVVDPTTGEVYASAPMSEPRTSTARSRLPTTAFESWARHDACATGQPALLKIADAVDERGPTRSSRSSARTPASRSA